MAERIGCGVQASEALGPGIREEIKKIIQKISLRLMTSTLANVKRIGCGIQASEALAGGV